MAQLFLPAACLLLCLALGYGEDEGFQPVCTSRFDHDFKVLQKLFHLQTEIDALKAKQPTAGSVKCPDGWIQYKGACYYFQTEARTYSGAQEYCESHGGKLAEPIATETNEFLKSVARRYKTANWWIGLNDKADEGHWVWTSSGGNPSYSDWKRGNPNQGRKCNCGGYWYLYDFGWVDEPCSNTYNSICEKHDN